MTQDRNAVIEEAILCVACTPNSEGINGALSRLRLLKSPVPDNAQEGVIEHREECQIHAEDFPGLCTCDLDARMAARNAPAPEGLDGESARLINRFEQLEGPFREIGAHQMAEDLFTAAEIMRKQFDLIEALRRSRPSPAPTWQPLSTAKLKMKIGEQIIAMHPSNDFAQMIYWDEGGKHGPRWYVTHTQGEEWIEDETGWVWIEKAGRPAPAPKDETK